MPRRMVKRSHRRRGTIHRKSPSKFTIIKVMKGVIALAPPAVRAATIYQSSGGGVAGAKQAVGSIVEDYTGIDQNTHKFDPSLLATGYVPLIGAWLFGKVASRVVRF